MRKYANAKRVVLILFSIIIIALLFRGMFFIKYLHSFKLEGDARNYHLMSHQLVDKGIFGYWYEGNKYGGKPGISNARVTPGYPLFLSLIYAVFHDPYLQITIARLLQVIIGGLVTPVLAFLFAKTAFKKDNIALLTSFFVAIYPTYIQSTINLLTEVLSLASMLLYLYLLLQGFRKRKFIINILAGGAFGVHILIRPAMLPLFIIPFFIALYEYKKDEIKALIIMFIQVSAGFVIVMLPWWIRNIVVLHKLVLTAGGSGNPLLAGSYPYAKAGMPNFMYDVPDSIRGKSDLQAQFAKERIIRGFKTEPLLYLKWYTIGKLQYMFGTPWLYFMDITTQIYHKIIHNFYVFFGLIGIIIGSVLNKLSRYINLFGFIFLVIYLAFDPQPRYIYQHMFFLMLGAAYLAVLCYEKLRGFRHKLYKQKL